MSITRLQWREPSHNLGILVRPIEVVVEATCYVAGVDVSVAHVDRQHMCILCHDMLSRILAESGSGREIYSGIEEVYKLSVSRAEEKRGDGALRDNSSPIISMPRIRIGRRWKAGEIPVKNSHVSIFRITVKFDILP